MEFPDVYNWICRACQWKRGGIESKVLNVFADGKYSILLHAKSCEGKISLSFQFLEDDTSKGKYEIGRYDIGKCSEESMQTDLLPVLLWLFFDPFILRSSKVICEAFSGYLDMFRELKLKPGIIEPTIYRQVFNYLISAGCTFLTNEMEDELLFEILAQSQQNTLSLMGLAGTDRFMGFLASTLFSFSFLSSKFPLSGAQRFLERNSSSQGSWSMEWIFERVSRISYNSSTELSWMITSYSPLSSLVTIKRHRKWADGERESLRWALNNNQLKCALQFDPVVNVCSDCIKVCLSLDNVRCGVFPLDRISDNKSINGLPNERHFLSRICLTIGPQNRSGIQFLSLGESTFNPATDFGSVDTIEGTFQTDMLGVKASKSTTVTERIKKWHFQHSDVKNIDAKLDWTLYDYTTKKPVFDAEPPKISFLSQKAVRSRYKAITEQKEVVFTKGDYGKPITWKFHRKLEGQTLKWNIQASIWLTYWSNAGSIRYFETKCHDFHQVFDLALLQSSSASTST